MKFAALSSSFLLFITSVVAQTAVSVSYDQTYDNSNGQLSSVACSDGPNGLLTKGYTTFGSLPSFPNIGGASAVTGWDSAGCGTCWALTYPDTDVTINFLAIDVASAGFNIALEAMNNLTNGEAEFLGRVEANAVQVSASSCGL